jgi:hypothetical protein
MRVMLSEYKETTILDLLANRVAAKYEAGRLKELEALKKERERSIIEQGGTISKINSTSNTPNTSKRNINSNSNNIAHSSSEASLSRTSPGQSGTKRALTKEEISASKRRGSSASFANGEEAPVFATDQRKIEKKHTEKRKEKEKKRKLKNGGSGSGSSSRSLTSPGPSKKKLAAGGKNKSYAMKNLDMLEASN